MFEVTIYVETSFHGPAHREAVGMWLIEYIKKDGTPETRQGLVCCQKTTENALALETLVIALERLKETCVIRVNTRCEHILNAVGNFWLPQWEKNGWINAKNKPVKNVESWKKVAEAKRKHLMSFENGYNSYRSVMENAMELGFKALRENKEEEKIICSIDLVNLILQRKSMKRQ